MTRRAHRYRYWTWACWGAMLATAGLMSLAWNSERTELWVLALSGLILSALGAAHRAIRKRRETRSSENVDFGAGIASYQLEEFDTYRDGA